jgi:hypothetical protein
VGIRTDVWTGLAMELAMERDGARTKARTEEYTIESELSAAGGENDAAIVEPSSQCAVYGPSWSWRIR